MNSELLHQAKFGINDASVQMKKIRQRTTVSALLFDFFEGRLLWLVVSFSARVRRYSVTEMLRGWQKEQAARRLFRIRIPPIKSLEPEGKGKKPWHWYKSKHLICFSVMYKLNFFICTNFSTLNPTLGQVSVLTLSPRWLKDVGP